MSRPFFAALRGLIERPRGGLRQWLVTALARSWRFGPESWHQSRARARRNILFHYDRDPEFYRQFLDERMVYSCAYFERPDMSIGEAQLAKLDSICRRLDLQPGERWRQENLGPGTGTRRLESAPGFFKVGVIEKWRGFA